MQASLVCNMQIMVYFKHHFDAAAVSRPSMFEDVLIGKLFKLNNIMFYVLFY